MFLLIHYLFVGNFCSSGLNFAFIVVNLYVWKQNAVRISSPDITPTTVPRPAATAHALPPRPAIVASPTIAPKPVPPSTASLPHSSLAPSLSPDTTSSSNTVRTTLIPPAFFVPPPRTSGPTAPPLATSTPPLQSAPHGAPLLQPFPPPNPPLSLAAPMLHSGPITREGVQDALYRLLKVKLYSPEVCGFNQFKVQCVHLTMWN